MVQTSEVIDGGGNPIRVGTTGTIGSLMTRELESLKHDLHRPIPCRKKPQTIPVSVPCGCTTPRKSQLKRNSLNEASSSGSNSNHRSPRSTQKTKHNLQKNEHQTPMLTSNGVKTVRNPNKEKLEKKGSYIVEIVDISCGSNTDKPWSGPITSRLKKLSFSKLSETVV